MHIDFYIQNIFISRWMLQCTRITQYLIFHFNIKHENTHSAPRPQLFQCYSSLQQTVFFVYADAVIWIFMYSILFCSPSCRTDPLVLQDIYTYCMSVHMYILILIVLYCEILKRKGDMSRPRMTTLPVPERLWPMTVGAQCEFLLLAFSNFCFLWERHVAFSLKFVISLE